MCQIAFVLGGANTLAYDLLVARDLVKPDTIIAANHAGRDYQGRLDHWCTLHTELMPEWIEHRRRHGRSDAGQLWTSNTKTIPSEHRALYRHVPSWNGSSGLLAVQVALELGYDRVILCGVPLDKTAEHYNYGGKWMDAPRYRSAWTKNLKAMQGKVKSPSGWTKRLLGEPNGEWIRG